jgi:N4-gp56 family major capsid protein
MAVNYAEKYSTNVDERFSQGARTGAAVNADYDWDGTSAIKVYSIDTSPLNDYQTTGTNRYGTPDELGNHTQTMLLSQDKAFTFTIDRKSYDDTQMTQEVGAALARELNEVVIPYIDKYRLQRMTNAVGSSATGTITKTTAYEAFLDGQAQLDDNNVPTDGRVAYVSNAFYKMLKLDENFIKASDIAMNMRISGQMGEVDGVAILKGTGILPENVNFIITHPIATTAAQKLEDYNIHQNPPGINGWLCEGRIRFDAFVRYQKRKAIYVHATKAIVADKSCELDENLQAEASTTGK